MPTMEDFFTSNYIKASDLQGHEVPVLIERFEAIEVGDKKEKKCALYFKGKKKALLLNKTNASKIANGYGSNLNDWIGKEILLYPDETQYQGQVVPCLRVRLPASKLEPGDEPLPF